MSFHLVPHLPRLVGWGLRISRLHRQTHTQTHRQTVHKFIDRLFALKCCGQTRSGSLARLHSNSGTCFTHVTATLTSGCTHSIWANWMQRDAVTWCLAVTWTKKRIKSSKLPAVAAIQLTVKRSQSAMMQVLCRPRSVFDIGRVKTVQTDCIAGFTNLFASRGIKTCQSLGWFTNFIPVQGPRTGQTRCRVVNLVSVNLRGIKTDQSSSSFINPLEELQKFVRTPIFSKEEEVFRPSQAEVEAAVSLFQSPSGSAKHAAKFIGSYRNGAELPQLELPEICFLGRSNVGKSSLIQCLLNAHPEVKVRISKQPGHTKSLNVYRVGSHLVLVDMPGYGHNMPPDFQRSVETYLATGRRLCRTFLLVDGEIGLTSTDRTALDMLQEFGVPYVIVLTKIDKAGRHKLLRNLMTVMEACRHSAGHTCFSQPFLVSSKHGDGVMLLQTFIAYITGCIYIKGL